MASIRVPSNVSSMTFASSGVKAPVANIISGITPAEAQAVSGQFTKGAGAGAKLVSTAADGSIVMSFPTVITSITINAVVYAVTGAITPWGKLLASAVPAPAATSVLSEGFWLVRG